jgi:hypothetical protein
VGGFVSRGEIVVGWTGHNRWWWSHQTPLRTLFGNYPTQAKTGLEWATRP